MKSLWACTLLVVLWLIAAPLPTLAQTGSGLAGTVRDTSGAVLPGVTVEASSPALIEKVRVVVTDSAGQYSITALSPGRYTVTFSLPGFTTVKREGIDLVTGFTANVNADLPVGSLAESITVTGASPVVDVQNTRQQVVVSRDLIDAVPTGKMFQQLAAMIPAVVVNQNDVGGARRAALRASDHPWQQGHRYPTGDRWIAAVYLDLHRRFRQHIVGRGLPGICARRVGGVGGDRGWGRAH